MTQHPQEAALRAGVAALALPLSDAQIQGLLSYLDWIAKWNRVYNLTALRDPQQMLTHHLLDSLAVIAPLRGHLQPPPPHRPQLLDVGAGAGLPGVVIALACPDCDVTCVDAVAKKARFVQQVAAALRLPNLHGVHARVETLTQSFDVITARAFASLPNLVACTRQALKPAGVWLALKGKPPHDEIAALPPTVEVFHVEPVRVPELDAQRCLVWMRPSKEPCQAAVA